MKVLNLYASLGGNRYKWDEVQNIEVTAIELDEELAKLYQERFPNDEVIIADAHQYLIDHYSEFDFIWSSPPCPSHSRSRFWNASGKATPLQPIYPDLKLYEEIIFLTHYFKGKFCIESVIPYYEPLIAGNKRGRHIYWTNFKLPHDLKERKSGIMTGKKEIDQWCKFHDFDFYQYQGNQRRDKIARNLVDYEAGKRIFETACGVIRKENFNQLDIFDQ